MCAPLIKVAARNQYRPKVVLFEGQLGGRAGPGQAYEARQTRRPDSVREFSSVLLVFVASPPDPGLYNNPTGKEVAPFGRVVVLWTRTNSVHYRRRESISLTGNDTTFHLTLIIPQASLIE